jgi:hypothetical protein
MFMSVCVCVCVCVCVFTRVVVGEVKRVYSLLPI